MRKMLFPPAPTLSQPATISVPASACDSNKSRNPSNASRERALLVAFLTQTLLVLSTKLGIDYCTARRLMAVHLRLGIEIMFLERDFPHQTASIPFFPAFPDSTSQLQKETQRIE
ncbi:predicted protein [Histoplasma capsulatum H143]|uniref:Uncharacterized protein n=1 Tax=Ajellomyces capsulatus (strain H143) TaxID=544712 RepID=C6HF64_AJECH|nr:predicted protein [Histoplasma capsulatum H143]